MWVLYVDYNGTYVYIVAGILLPHVHVNKLAYVAFQGHILVAHIWVISLVNKVADHSGLDLHVMQNNVVYM